MKPLQKWLARSALVIFALSFVGADGCTYNIDPDQPHLPVENPASIPLATKWVECPGKILDTLGTWRVSKFTVGPVKPGYRVVLSQYPDGTGETLVDDFILLICDKLSDTGLPLEGTQDAHFYDYSIEKACADLTPQPPQDLTYLFSPDRSVQCQLLLMDVCGVCVGSSDLWLSYVKDP